MSDENANTEEFHSKLESLGVEIDMFERDDFHKLVFEGEVIN
jgi:hypothetical protein